MKYEIFGIKIDKVNSNRISSLINGYFKSNLKKIIFYVNAHTINIAQSDPSFMKAINIADLVYCGGLGPVIGARLMYNIRLSKTTTPDFIMSVFQYMEKNSKSVFFLGSKETDLIKMIDNLKKQFPKLIIKGHYNGYFPMNKNSYVISYINNVHPDLLLVGMGSPKQEKWTIDNYKNIDAKVFWAVGAIFEVLSGQYKRLPKIFNDYGFEWIFRLIQEPKRLGKRYLIGNIKLLLLIARNYFNTKRL